MVNIDVNSLLVAPTINKCKKVLCIQPHPDDNEIGMSGIIAKLANQGSEIHYLTITDGRLGDLGTSYTPDQLAAVRKQEAEEAGRLLGAKKFFWFNYKDGSLNSIPLLTGKIGEVIRQEQYDTIFCPDPWLNYEAHYDHIVTGKASAQAAISFSLRSYPEGTHTTSCKLHTIGIYFTASPNKVVNITEYFNLKMKQSLHIKLK